jgi:hypothetical protein
MEKKQYINHKFRISRQVEISPNVFLSIYDSSNLSRSIWDSTRETMLMVFKSGSVYEYQNVTEELYDTMNERSSSGSYFYYNIRTDVPYRKVR